MEQPQRKPRRDGRMMPMGRPFKKGESGNPQGLGVIRAPFDIEKHAQQYSEEMTDTLVEIARNKKYSPSVRVSAAEAVLNRAHGRPKQALDVSGQVNMGLSFNAFVRELITGSAVEAMEAEEENEPQLIEVNGHDHHQP